MLEYPEKYPLVHVSLGQNYDHRQLTSKKMKGRVLFGFEQQSILGFRGTHPLTHAQVMGHPSTNFHNLVSVDLWGLNRLYHMASS